MMYYSRVVVSIICQTSKYQSVPVHHVSVYRYVTMFWRGRKRRTGKSSGGTEEEEGRREAMEEEGRRGSNRGGGKRRQSDEG